MIINKLKLHVNDEVCYLWLLAIATVDIYLITVIRYSCASFSFKQLVQF